MSGEALKADDLVAQLLADAEEIAGWGAGNEAGRVREAAARIIAVEAERDAMAKIARDLTKGLVQLTPSGSEYFIRHGDDYYADVEACQRVVRERYASGHQAKINLVDAGRRATKAEARIAVLEKALESAVAILRGEVGSGWAERNQHDWEIIDAALTQEPS